MNCMTAFTRSCNCCSFNATLACCSGPRMRSARDWVLALLKSSFPLTWPKLVSIVSVMVRRSALS